MPLKNGNTVAVERRVDLASLFCMIGRHGPAVALAVIAMLSVLAGFIIYRSVRGKRRKATAAAADGDSQSPGAERDTSVIRPSPEETQSSVESTDTSAEDVDLIQSDLKLRHRRTAAAVDKKHAPYSPPKRDIQVPDNKQTTSGDTEEMAAVRVSNEVAEAFAEEANQCLQSDTYTVAEMAVEAPVDCHQDAIDDDSYLKESETINDENHKKKEEVLEAECQEEKDVTTDMDISGKKTRQEAETFVCSVINPVCSKQTPHMGEKVDDDRLQDDKTTLETNSVESNLEEPVIHIEDVPVSCICYGKDEEFEGENPDIMDCSSYSNQKKSEHKEAKEERTDYHRTAQQAEIWSSTFEQESNLPSTQPPIRDRDLDEEGGVAGEVVEHLNKRAAVSFDEHSSQLDMQEVDIEKNVESGLGCKKEDGVLYDGVDQVKEKRLTSDNIVASSEEFEGSSVAPSPALLCLSMPLKIDNNDNGLSGITSDAKALISDKAGFSDLSTQSQQPQKENKIDPSLDEDTDSTVLDPQMPPHETENQPDNNENSTTIVLAEDYIDSHVQSCNKDQHSSKMINNVFDKASVAVDPDNVDNASNNGLLISEQIYHPDMLCGSQTPQSDNMENSFSEVTGVAAPVMPDNISPPMCQIHLTYFEQSEQMDNDMSSYGIGKESGISSMAVSPDLQDTSNEFDVIVQSDLQSEGQTEAPNSLFADDVAISVINDDRAGMVFEPYPSCDSHPHHSENTDWTNYESFAANEDIFGHEVEDCYQKAMDQFMAQITVKVPSVTDELKTQTDVKAVVEVIEIEEKKAGISVEKKEVSKAEKEKEEDYEKTEISIMEATMDNNEWITDSNYQVLPWMNLSAQSSAQDHTNNNQLPTECQYSSAVTDTTYIDATDIPPSTEVKQTSTVSLDENTENNKKVVAVQPMPQNVNVTFRIHYVTHSPHQMVAVTGDRQELGNWKGFIPLERAMDGLWTTVVSLPAENHVEWKFVLVDKGEICRWEECGNRLLDTGYGDDLLVHKLWGFL
ncbi:uncharacterized protein stbd1 [Micropterus salmoides]|uniref:uncharacterized protein stbd1 n=1 Tax=Micropterus salmoides TaxID=27706 RepID=UPI0018EA52D4|nr:uncharacterized protein stbd1 [Micropterus salmoides]